MSGTKCNLHISKQQIMSSANQRGVMCVPQDVGASFAKCAGSLMMIMQLDSYRPDDSIC